MQTKKFGAACKHNLHHGYLDIYTFYKNIKICNNIGEFHLAVWQTSDSGKYELGTRAVNNMSWHLSQNKACNVLNQYIVYCDLNYNFNTVIL